jgi:hypothetical protein
MNKMMMMMKKKRRRKKKKKMMNMNMNMKKKRKKKKKKLKLIKNHKMEFAYLDFIHFLKLKNVLEMNFMIQLVKYFQLRVEKQVKMKQMKHFLEKIKEEKN